MRWKNINLNFRYIVLGMVLLLGLSFCVTNRPQASAFADTSYTVSFDYNESAISSNLALNQAMRESIENYTIDFAGGYLSNTQIKKPSNLFNSYYTYQWTYNGQVVDVESINITSDTTFKLKWTPVKYYVNFNFSTEEIRNNITNLVDKLEFTIESPRIELYEPNLPHYRFDGWYNGGVHYELMYLPAGSTGTKNFTARFTPIDYSINYNTRAQNANNPKYYSVKDDDIVLAPASQEGHIFKGWYSDSKYQNFVSVIDCSKGGNIELFPLWELEEYTVTYIMPDGYKRKVQVEYGKKAELPEINKSIFEIVTTDVSRKNITKDTTITIKVINIWYVYALGVLAIAGVAVAIVVVKKRREQTHDTLRNKYLAGAARTRATVSIIEKVPTSPKRNKETLLYRSSSISAQNQPVQLKEISKKSSTKGSTKVQKTEQSNNTSTKSDAVTTGTKAKISNTSLQKTKTKVNTNKNKEPQNPTTKNK